MLRNNFKMATKEDLTPEAKEKKHVHTVYTEIAKHFSETRYKPWPQVAAFINELKPGSLLADIGCGNGKYLALNDSLVKLGVDTCPELLRIAAHSSSSGGCSDVAVSDCLSLPIRSGLFDATLCIAVLHHLSTTERRGAALRELVRITAPGGTLLVYVWAYEQKRRKFEGQDVMVPWHLQPQYSSEDRPSKGEAPQRPDLKGQGYVTYQRFYHVFVEGELRQLFQDFAPEVEVQREFFDHENWCVLALKK